MDSKNILVTGGAGYIGSHVVKELCKLDYNVVVFDNLSLGHKENVDPKAELIIGNISDSAKLDSVLSNNIDAVFHFAAWKAAGESMVNPMKYSENNISGTLSLLSSMIRNNVKKIIFSSSAAVYGSPEYLPVDEKHPVNPENYYGYSKLAIEENLKWYDKLMGLKFAALRYFNATGYDVDGKIVKREKNPENLTPIVMETAAGERDELKVFGNDYDTADGTCIRDYIHVNDLASAHIKAMEYLKREEKSLIVNLGTGQGHSVIDIVKAAAEVYHKKINYRIVERRVGDPACLIACSNLANYLLNWYPEYSDLNTILYSMKPLY